MLCPFCGYESSKVLESRSTAEKLSIRRRRECESCQKRFTTYEKIEMLPLHVIKKNGSRVEYSREKLLNSINMACNKCNVSTEVVEEFIDNLEFELSASPKREINSCHLGEKILEYLKNIDEVAYLRYLSVFKRFRTSDDFIFEARNIEKRSAAITIKL